MVDRPFGVPSDNNSEAQRARGLKISQAGSRSLADWYYDPKLAWLVRFSLPFSWAASKNSIYGRMSDIKKRTFIRAESRNYRDAITLLTKQAMKGVDLKHDKLWLDIFVEKPNQRGDAVNVIDLVCDAIKRAIPIDDRWYSIRRLDWEINKNNPHLFIGLSQEEGAVDSKACSYCGQIKPLTAFTFARSNTHGRGYICAECRAPTYNKGPNKKHRNAGSGNDC